MAPAVGLTFARPWSLDRALVKREVEAVGMGDLMSLARRVAICVERLGLGLKPRA